MKKHNTTFTFVFPCGGRYVNVSPRELIYLHGGLSETREKALFMVIS